MEPGGHSPGFPAREQLSCGSHSPGHGELPGDRDVLRPGQDVTLRLGWLSRAGTQLKAGTTAGLVSLSLGLRLGSNGAPGPQDCWEELFTPSSKAKAELLYDPCKKCL